MQKRGRRGIQFTQKFVPKLTTYNLGVGRLNIALAG
jgi:hypothetical protein